MSQEITASSSRSAPFGFSLSRLPDLTEDAPLRRLQILAVVALLILYGGSLSSTWLVEKDSALYLLLGKSVADGNGYTLFGQPHAFVPPGYPLLIAALTSVGLGDMIWLNLAMILMGLGVLWFTYRILLELTNPVWALAVTFVVGASATMFRASVSQMSDVPFMLIMLGAIWCTLLGLKGKRYWLEAGSLLFVLGLWVRVIGLPVALGAAIGMLIQPGHASRLRRRLNAAGIVAGLLLTGATFVWQSSLAQSRSAEQLPSYQDHYFAKMGHLSASALLIRTGKNAMEAGSELARLFTAQTLPEILALFILTIPVLVGMGIAFHRRRYVCLGIVICYLGMIMPFGPVLARYLLPLAPFLITYYVQGLSFLVKRLPRPPQRGTALAGVCVLLLLLNLPKDLLLVYELHGKGWTRNRLEWPAIQEAAEFLRQTAAPDEKIIGSMEYVFAYLSDVPCSQMASSLARKHLSHEEVLTSLESHRAELVIVQEGPSHAFAESLRQSVQDEQHFERLFDNGLFRIYRKIGDADPARLGAVPGESLKGTRQ